MWMTKVYNVFDGVKELWDDEEETYSSGSLGGEGSHRGEERKNSGGDDKIL